MHFLEIVKMNEKKTFITFNNKNLHERGFSVLYIH